MPEVRVVRAERADAGREHRDARGDAEEEDRAIIVVNQQTIAGEAARYAGRNATSIADMAQLKSAIRQTILASRLEKVGLDNAQMKEITFIPLDFSTERITERGRGRLGNGERAVRLRDRISALHVDRDLRPDDHERRARGENDAASRKS